MIIDFVIAVALILLGKIQFKYRAVKVAGVSALVSTVALTPIFLIVSMLAIIFLKWLVVVIFLLIAAIAKLKALAFLKIGMIIGGIATGVAGIFSGPPGWILLTIVVFIFFGSMISFSKDAFFWIFEKYLRFAAKIMSGIRSISDGMSHKMGPLGVLLFFPFEFAIVSIIPFYGLYEIWNFFSGPIYGIDREIFRLSVATFYSIFVFIDYRKATSVQKEVYPDIPDILDVDGPVL